MSALHAELPILEFADPQTVLPALARDLRGGRIVPYLGPGLLTPFADVIPTTPELLAEFLGTKVSLPKRARGNAWAAAQYIESNKHRSTVTALMTEAFAPAIAPTPFHLYLASLHLPMIVDSWYDGGMRRAFGVRTDWGEVQGVTRAGIGEDQWYRFYKANGEEADVGLAHSWQTLLYKPHGGIEPAKNFLISDADYVEVLTEIDIQTPLPEIVRDRRANKSFLFVGCRFHDQLLRTYARQVTKRSTAAHYALVAPNELTKNEIRFLTAQGIVPIAASVDQALASFTS